MPVGSRGGRGTWEGGRKEPGSEAHPGNGSRLLDLSPPIQEVLLNAQDGCRQETSHVPATTTTFRACLAS